MTNTPAHPTALARTGPGAPMQPPPPNQGLHPRPLNHLFCGLQLLRCPLTHHRVHEAAISSRNYLQTTLQGGLEVPAASSQDRERHSITDTCAMAFQWSLSSLIHTHFFIVTSNPPRPRTGSCSLREHHLNLKSSPSITQKQEVS